MSARQPVPYEQPYATPAGQPAPVRDLVIRPTYGTVQPYADRDPVVYVPSADNPSVMVAVEKRYVQPMQAPAARDLTPVPLIDPQAQRILAGGVGIGAAGAGIGYGAGQMFAGIALMSTSGFAVFLGLFLMAANLRSARGDKHIHKTTHVHQKWLGTTNVSN